MTFGSYNHQLRGCYLELILGATSQNNLIKPFSLNLVSNRTSWMSVDQNPPDGVLQIILIFRDSSTALTEIIIHAEAHNTMKIIQLTSLW